MNHNVGLIYDKNWILFKGEAEDAHWLKYRAMEETMRVVKIEGGYAFKKDIQDAYFYPNEMGNFQVKPRLKRIWVL